MTEGKINSESDNLSEFSDYLVVTEKVIYFPQRQKIGTLISYIEESIFQLTDF